MREVYTPLPAVVVNSRFGPIDRQPSGRIPWTHWASAVTMGALARKVVRDRIGQWILIIRTWGIRSQ